MTGTLPQLIEEDIQQINAVFADFLRKSEADLVLLTAEGGFLVTQYGDLTKLDITTLGALASNCFEANKAIAGLIGEPAFGSTYQAGERSSVFVQSIDGFNLMVIIFPVTTGVGAIKYYAQIARDELVKIFDRARQRCPGGDLDLVLMNPTDSTQFFKRQ